MNETDRIIDRMLDLTAAIADELLLLKDAEASRLPDELKMKIISLAELAATPQEEQQEPELEEPAAEPESEAPAEPVTEEQEIANAAEFEEEADADELPQPEPAPEPTIPAPEPIQPPQVSVTDLQRAFSINDAFLFRREIFGGSREQFNEALEIISRFRDVSELQAYLEGLGLNLEQSPGKDFYQVLAPFFLS